MLETVLECSETVLSTLNHCLLRLDNYPQTSLLATVRSKDSEHVLEPIRLQEFCLELSASILNYVINFLSPNNREGRKRCLCNNFCNLEFLVGTSITITSLVNP